MSSNRFHVPAAVGQSHSLETACLPATVPSRDGEQVSCMLGKAKPKSELVKAPSSLLALEAAILILGLTC